MSTRDLPQWQPTPPPAPGVYFTFSDLEQRTDGVGVSRWDGKVWQTHLGWYDNAITHWMATALNDQDGDPQP